MQPSNSQRPMHFGTIITATILAVSTFTTLLDHVMEAPTYIMRLLHFFSMQHSPDPQLPLIDGRLCHLP